MNYSELLNSFKLYVIVINQYRNSYSLSIKILRYYISFKIAKKYVTTKHIRVNKILNTSDYGMTSLVPGQCTHSILVAE